MAAVAMVETTEIRVARLESDVAHIRSDVADLKVDVREMRKEIGGLRAETNKGFKTAEHSNTQTRVWMLLIGGAILGVLAHAVHWL